MLHPESLFLLVVIAFVITVVWLKRKDFKGFHATELTENTAPASMWPFKLISYTKALEASKKFIYDIARLVMQRFSSDDKRTLLNIGKRMSSSGMKYVHLVDVFYLSWAQNKEVSMQKTTTKNAQR